MSTRRGSGAFALDVERSRICFTVRHALISKVRGCFEDFDGSAELDFDDPGSSFAEISIGAASISTGNDPRDEQLRVNEFLDAPTYPTITFTSTGVVRLNDRRFDVTGNLTIKATTREVTVTFELHDTEPDADSIRFTGVTTVNRRDWSVEWPAPLETGGVLVGDKVTIEIDATVTEVDTS